MPRHIGRVICDVNRSGLFLQGLNKNSYEELMDVKENLSTKLKALREDSGLSQEKLAAKADISPRYYQRIESKISKPSIDTIFKISDALGLDYTEVLNTVWEDWKSNK